MNEFDKLYINVDESALWHLYDKEMKGAVHRDTALVALIIFGMFLYLPMILTIIVTAGKEPALVSLMGLFVLMCVFWHMIVWQTTRYNVYLGKYLKDHAKARELMESAALEYLPMQTYLYDQKYRFCKGFIYEGELVLEFNDGRIPVQIQGPDYRIVCTEDENLQGTIALNGTGLVAYIR